MSVYHPLEAAEGLSAHKLCLILQAKRSADTCGGQGVRLTVQHLVSHVHLRIQEGYGARPQVPCICDARPALRSNQVPAEVAGSCPAGRQQDPEICV